MTTFKKRPKKVQTRKPTSLNGIDYRGASKSTCPSGKWGWLPEYKAGAKTLLKALKHQGDRGSRVYRCGACDRWHVGRQPRAVAEGRISAREFYDLDGAARRRLSREDRSEG